ncbi:hypothetical protein KGA66_19080 [Actinocrinis puniceicyclus]|uniref:NnrS family protein n=1 Tax=Actinocrinis puniceicyclus TaxID=977794 RepID=A0A8J7WSG1_9ACTN|nr:hypothetical protein [Actinocrinis puniceicyclus]MBS2965162.1 hypothetical protein [Actinocrinis puniceicyclus]
MTGGADPAAGVPGAKLAAPQAQRTGTPASAEPAGRGARTSDAPTPPARAPLTPLVSLSPAAPRRPSGSGRSRFAAPALAFGLVALLAGLQRLGLPVPSGRPSLPELHGVLMPLGFLGTLIAAERAVALGRGWAWLAPAFSGVGSLWLIAGLPSGVGRELVALGGFALLAVFARLHRIQPSTHNLVMAAGAACWCVAGTLWVGRWDLAALVPWLAGFLVLTIAGERLELSRLVALTRRGRALFLAAVALFLAGLALSLPQPEAGVRTAGAGLLALSAWLASHDIARRTIRMPGVTRFMATGLAAGYLWLAVAGGLWLAIGRLSDGPGYDAMLHAVFLGFVFSMVFAHAPVIVPAVLRVRLPFHRAAYGPLALLHASLALRLIGGDAAGSTAAWQAGGVLNEVAILGFLATMATVAVRARRRSGG